MANLDVIVYILGFAVLVLASLVIHLEAKLKRLLGGKDAKTLEEAVVSMKNGLTSLNKFKEESLGYYSEVEERLKRSVQAVETIRFNPFKGTGMGGNQSFSTTFINEEGNGVMISSLYSHERISVFSKPLKNYSSEFEMTGEEKEVLEKAKKTIEGKK